MGQASTEQASPEGKSADFDLRPLMFQIFVCSMSMMAFVSLSGPLARVIGLQAWQIGTAMTVAGVAWMVMARIWGGLSDSKGRRRILLLGCTGFGISYLALAVFIDVALKIAMWPMLAFVGIVAGRGLAGLFYSAVPATSAALVADNVPPQGRGAAMASIGAASASGMVIGPGLAGLLAPISLSLPFYLTAILPLLGLAILWRTLPKAPQKPLPPKKRLGLFDLRLRRPMSVAFAAMFSVTIAQIMAGFYALDRLAQSPTEAGRTAGIALALVGGALVVSQTVLRKLEWPPARFIRIGGVVAACGFSSVMLAQTPWMLWAGYTVAALGMGWIYPSVSAMAANNVGAGEQGAAGGTIAAAQGLGGIVGPMVGTALYTLGAGAPYAMIGLVLLVVALWPSKPAQT